MKVIKTSILALSALLMPGSSAVAQQQTISKTITIDSSKPSGMIDPMLYGQLFEHIYFSANNGVWQELLFERSFEPEHFPGIPPRDGYFDGWFADDDNVLHSPTRYEQPIKITSLETDDYDITLDVNWRSYRLARRAWSGGLMDIRFAFGNQANGEPYFVRMHNPYYEVRSLSVAQTEEMRKNEELARAREAMKKKDDNAANFSISTQTEKEVEMWGRKRKVKAFEALVKKIATDNQINERQDWHKLRISRRGNTAKVFYDGKQILAYNKIDKTGKNDITFWVNYTEALYRNIKVTSADGKKVYFEGMPQDVRIPDVAPQWKSFGNGEFKMVKSDAVNMNYSQQISSKGGEAGLVQGPQNVVAGEKYIGYIHAKGQGTLSVALRNGDKVVARQALGTMGNEWKKYEFELSTPTYSGDADFAICVENGTVQVDEASMTTASGKALGGFRPDIFNTVKKLHPTCMRWPGGGYVAQYDWKWGIGPQEKRRRWDHWMWMDYDQNCFGTDEFIRFCHEVNSEPVLVVSVAFERPDSEADAIMENALNWLRYCNEPASGEWGAKRAANGHPEPYNIKYWEIDNEMWEMGIEKYEACVRRYSEAMRKIDPTIKIIACGGFQEDSAFIARSGNYFDYLSLHHYERENGYATGPVNLGKQYDHYADMIAKSPNPNIKLFISEWNLNSQDWRTGLFAGGFLNMCETKDVVAMGAAALFIRRTDSPDWNNAFINFDYKDVYVAPNYQVTDLWYDNFSRYLLSYTGDTGELNVVTTMSEDGKSVIVKVVNPTDKAYSLVLKNDRWPAKSDASYEYYAPGNLMVGNTMDNKNAVVLKTMSVTPSDNTYTLSVEAYSAGVMRIER